MKKEKQPWNPFPLAVLKVDGLSACAKTVLIYLGVRSNWKGETCVGHATMCRELVRSKDFVTKGLQELYEKELVKTDGRVRHKGQADWRVLSQVILKSRNTDEVDQSYLAGQVSPEEQEYDNPAQQGETLQIKKNPNLTEDNLTDLSFCQSVSQPSNQNLEEKPEELESTTEEQKQPQEQNQEQDPELEEFTESILDASFVGGGINTPLGFSYFTTDHVPLVRRMARVMRRRNRSVMWLTQLVYWAKGISDPKDREAIFWKRRLGTGDKAVAKLAEYMETGTIAEQFDVRLLGMKKSLEVARGIQNELLYHDGAWYVDQESRYGKCEGCGSINYHGKNGCICHLIHRALEPGSMEEVMEQNQAKAAAAAAADAEDEQPMAYHTTADTTRGMPSPCYAGCGCDNVPGGFDPEEA